MLYDCHFRLKASATKSKNWSSIEINIWNTTFAESAITTAAQKAPHYSGTGAPAHSSQQPSATHKNFSLYWMMILALIILTLISDISTAVTVAFATLG